MGWFEISGFIYEKWRQEKKISTPFIFFEVSGNFFQWTFFPMDIFPKSAVLNELFDNLKHPNVYYTLIKSNSWYVRLGIPEKKFILLGHQWDSGNRKKGNWNTWIIDPKNILIQQECALMTFFLEFRAVRINYYFW